MMKRLSLPCLLLLFLGTPAYLQAQGDDELPPAVEEEDTEQKRDPQLARNSKQKRFALVALGVGGTLGLVYLMVQGGGKQGRWAT